MNSRAEQRQEGDDGEDRPIHVRDLYREHEPGDEGGGADQHGEGVVIEIAGLQPHDVARDVEHAGGDAVGAEAVDQPAVAALPQHAAEPLGRAHEDEVVEFVEVPLVEQEAVQQLVLAREFDRNIRPADIELPGDDEADHHHHRRQQADPERDVLHVLEHGVALGEGERLAEEALDAVTGEDFLERQAGQDRADGEEAERDQHDHRAFVRVLPVLAVVRLAVEGLEDQPPGIERGQQRGARPCR